MARKLCTTLAVALFAGALLAGCNTRGNLTPELRSHSGAAEQDQNRYARVVDNNTRQIWDDVERLFLFDRSSTLHEYPVP